MAECGYCKDCKWWDTYHLHGTGDCTLIHKEQAKMRPSPRCYSYYGSDQDVEVETDADFGCVQWRAKLA